MHTCTLGEIGPSFRDLVIVDSELIAQAVTLILSARHRYVPYHRNYILIKKAHVDWFRYILILGYGKLFYGPTKWLIIMQTYENYPPIMKFNSFAKHFAAGNHTSFNALPLSYHFNDQLINNLSGLSNNLSGLALKFWWILCLKCLYFFVEFK